MSKSDKADGVKESIKYFFICKYWYAGSILVDESPCSKASYFVIHTVSKPAIKVYKAQVNDKVIIMSAYPSED